MVHNPLGYSGNRVNWSEGITPLRNHAHTTANPKFRDSSLEFIQNSTGGHVCPIHALRLTRQRREALNERQPRESMNSNHRANLHYLTDWGEAGETCWLPRSRDAPPI